VVYKGPGSVLPNFGHVLKVHRLVSEGTQVQLLGCCTAQYQTTYLNATGNHRTEIGTCLQNRQQNISIRSSRNIMTVALWRSRLEVAQQGLPGESRVRITGVISDFQTSRLSD